METLLHRRRDRHTPKSIIFVGVMVLLAMLLAACGSSGTSTGSGTPLLCLSCSSATNNSSPPPTPIASIPSLKPPTDLSTPGTLTVGSDTTYPPQEFIDTATGQAKGFDVDLITAMAQTYGPKSKCCYGKV